MAGFYPDLPTLHAEQREVVLCGDWNIAYKAIDCRGIANQIPWTKKSPDGRGDVMRVALLIRGAVARTRTGMPCSESV